MESDDAKDPMAIRINRYLSQCGFGARRKCDELIRGGHVFVNGEKVVELGTKIGSGDRVEYHGKEIKPMNRLEYIAYHKPIAVMVTKNDPEGRPTVYDELRASGFDAQHLNYIGRLDFHSEGLLLLSNDGSLIHALTHPRYQIKKIYQVQIDRPMSASEIDILMAGVESEGQVLHAGAIRKSADKPVDQYWYEVDLYEGKNRQIRRMFEVIHRRLIRLRRIKFAAVSLGDLAPGAIRPLTDKEIGALKAAGYKENRRA